MENWREQFVGFSGMKVVFNAVHTVMFCKQTFLSTWNKFESTLKGELLRRTNWPRVVLSNLRVCLYCKSTHLLHWYDPVHSSLCIYGLWPAEKKKGSFPGACIIDAHSKCSFWHYSFHNNSIFFFPWDMYVCSCISLVFKVCVLLENLD